MADTLLQSWGSRSKITVIPPFIPAIPETTPAYRRESSEILFVGRIVREKGLQLLIRASEMISTPHHVTVAGEGPYRQAIEEQIAEAGLTDQITLLGWQSQEQLSSLYRSAAVVAIPSIWPEPFGLIGPEAMGHCRPVVAFDMGGISDWLEDGETGFLIRHGDIYALVEKLELLLKRPVLAEAMGQRGREVVEQYSNPERHLSDLVNVYQEAITACGETR